MPTKPSLPTTAISDGSVRSTTPRSETMAVVGKYAWRRESPGSGSYSTWPSGMSTRSSCGSQRRKSAPASAASRRFFLTSEDVDIQQALASIGSLAI